VSQINEFCDRLHYLPLAQQFYILMATTASVIARCEDPYDVADMFIERLKKALDNQLEEES
jgi:hypothetical protein